jgi:hypothetical protein
MSSSNTIKILVALIGALGVIIAALITGVFALLVEQTKSNANATNVAATFVAQRTADVPVAQATYTLPPTHTPLPTQQPYTAIPTPKPNVTVVTPKPEIVTATPSADQQNPPPGSILRIGQSYKKNNITISSSKSIGMEYGRFSFSIYIENQGNQQIVVLWRNSFVHLRDDKGKEFHQAYESSSDWNRNKQFTVPNSEIREMPSKSWAGFYNTDDAFDWFVGRLDPNVKYLVLTIDQLAGMTNLNWRYDIQQ